MIKCISNSTYGSLVCCRQALCCYESKHHQLDQTVHLLCTILAHQQLCQKMSTNHMLDSTGKFDFVEIGNREQDTAGAQFLIQAKGLHTLQRHIVVVENLVSYTTEKIDDSITIFYFCNRKTKTIKINKIITHTLPRV